MNTFPVIHRLPAVFCAALGRAIVRWAYIEWRLRQMTYQLLNVSPKHGRIAVREPRVADHITMIQDLLELNSMTVKTDLRDLKKLAGNAETVRDWFAHGVWLRDRKNKKILLQVVKGSWQPDPTVQTTISRKKKPQGIELDSSKISRLTTMTDIVINRLNGLDQEIASALAASHKKSA